MLYPSNLMTKALDQGSESACMIDSSKNTFGSPFSHLMNTNFCCSKSTCTCLEGLAKPPNTLSLNKTPHLIPLCPSLCILSSLSCSGIPYRTLSLSPSLPTSLCFSLSPSPTISPYDALLLSFSPSLSILLVYAFNVIYL